MTSDTVAVLIALGLVAVVWHFAGGGASSASPPPPTDVTGTGTGAASDPTSTGLNNQSGTYSTGVQA